MNSSNDDIKKYWNERARIHQTNPTATTNDIFLRKIEISNCIQSISEEYEIKRVADVGCGNGFSTLQLATHFPNLHFSGFDYSEDMIKNAQKMKAEQNIDNIDFDVYDVLSGTLSRQYDYIITDRCLINLPSWDLQKQGLKNLRNSLTSNGIYHLIENFIDGQNNFNEVRRSFSLPEIPVRSHNHFFERQKFEDYIKDKFEILNRENISSAYYLVSRVIYSAICQKQGLKPDYQDVHHELGSKLPFAGEFGPVVMYKLRRQ